MRILFNTPGRILRGILFSAARGIACMAVFSMLFGLLFPVAARGTLDPGALEEALAGQQDLLYVFSFTSLPVAVMNELISKVYPLPGGSGENKKPLPEKQDERAAQSTEIPLLLTARQDTARAVLQPDNGAGKLPYQSFECAAPPGGQLTGCRVPGPPGQHAFVLLTAFFFLFLLPRSSLEAEADRKVVRRTGARLAA
ncbi:MAG: hypothetical protein ACYC5N_08590 [Endomicrobiales bacterium]